MNKLLSIIISILGFINTANSQNSALNFDGVDDSVEIPNEVGNFDFNEDFTISVWIKPASIQSEQGYDSNDILNNNSGETYPFAIQYNNKKAGLKEGKIYVTRSDGGRGNFIMLNSTKKVNDGKWHHIIFMKSKENLTLYIDGEISAFIEDITTKTTKDESPLYIGGSPYSPQNFTGEIDEVRIWNRSLANDIDNINSITPIKNGLVAAYNFNEGKPDNNNLSINIANNFLGNNHGILQNFRRSGNNSNYVISGAKLVEDKPSENLTENTGIKKRPVSTEKRVALIIGNSNYTAGGTVLKNPKNDANLMINELKALGFEVISVIDGTLISMKAAIREYGSLLSRDKNTMGLFFYSGHGMQIHGTNYLIPVNAICESDADVDDGCVKLDYLIDKINDSKNDMNIVILDACRTNPFAKGWNRGNDEQGYAAPKLKPSGTVIAYATADGTTASDGIGENGLYTKEFVKAMKNIDSDNDGIEDSLIDVLQIVGKNVKALSNGKQIPNIYLNFEGKFYFHRN